jgi:hypothetical protein
MWQDSFIGFLSGIDIEKKGRKRGQKKGTGKKNTWIDAEKGREKQAVHLGLS